MAWHVGFTTFPCDVVHPSLTPPPFPNPPTLPPPPNSLLPPPSSLSLPPFIPLTPSFHPPLSHPPSIPLPPFLPPSLLPLSSIPPSLTYWWCYTGLLGRLVHQTWLVPLYSLSPMLLLLQSCLLPGCCRQRLLKSLPCTPRSNLEQRTFSCVYRGYHDMLHVAIL